MNLPKKIQVPQDVVSQTLGDEVVLLNLRTGVYWNLNASGALIWNEVQAHGNPQKASEALRQAFETTRTEAEEAVSGLLHDLSREGLIQIQQ